ncbi:hypothetical protein SAMN04489742_0256 [Arthrobacter crystallopoietes]|uniref:Uncharacterized protein n=1 Tax=Crystallibacter crystallopoietes TaxID=37928 RepID=A0A1H0ZBN6_9MICC|nr:hypothetical protein SAMN04489742_0256 [Arthrobacter crystallopoietes]
MRAFGHPAAPCYSQGEALAWGQLPIIGCGDPMGLKRKWRRLSDAKKRNIANTVVAVLAVLVLAAVAYAMLV